MITVKVTLIYYVCKIRQKNHLFVNFQGGKSMSRMEVETILDANSLSFAQKVGDWLVLFFITKNLDTLTNNELIK